MASGQRPTPVGWYEPPLYGRTLSITIAFISGCLIAFLLGSYTAVRPLALSSPVRVVLTVLCVPSSSKQSVRGQGLASAAVYHVGWVPHTNTRNMSFGMFHAKPPQSSSRYTFSASSSSSDPRCCSSGLERISTSKPARRRWDYVCSHT